MSLTGQHHDNTSKELPSAGFHLSVFKRVLRLRFGNFVGFGSPTKFFGILDFSWSQIFVNYFFSKLKFPGKKDKTVYPAVLFIFIVYIILF